MKTVRFAILASCALGVSACAHASRRPATAAVAPPALGLSTDELQGRGAAAMRDARWSDAIAAFSELTARNPRNAADQTMLALAYHRAGDKDPEAYELALAGYDAALRAEPGNFWAAALAGRVAFERGNYPEATRRYAQAVLADPRSPDALMALGTAAYRSGDIVLAAAAAERSSELSTDRGVQARSLQLAILSEAGAGEIARSKALLERLRTLDPAAAGQVQDRAAQLAGSAAVDTEGGQGQAETPPSDPKQITVDVTIVLAQNTAREKIGMNLLDGLSAQFGYSRQTARRNDRVSPGSFERVITDAISIPQLTYNLNLFNRGGQFYQVVARPSLTAYLGETSEFFVGRSLKVGVSGVNLGQLENIDVGIELKVTPIEITGQGTRVKIETGRSFLTADPAGSFAEALTTFRQRVAATAEVNFGETLVLSGLSESVDDSTFSKTPLVGDIPIVGSLFNERQKASRRDAVLILVTPARPAALPGKPWAREAAVARLASLWSDLVDPSSNGVDTANRLRRMRMFSRMRAGDSPLAWPDAGSVTGHLVGELLAPGAVK